MAPQGPSVPLRAEERQMCNPLLESVHGPKKDGPSSDKYDSIFVLSQMMGERTFHLLSEVIIQTSLQIQSLLFVRLCVDAPPIGALPS